MRPAAASQFHRWSRYDGMARGRLDKSAGHLEMAARLWSRQGWLQGPAAVIGELGIPWAQPTAQRCGFLRSISCLAGAGTAAVTPR